MVTYSIVFLIIVFSLLIRGLYKKRYKPQFDLVKNQATSTYCFYGITSMMTGKTGREFTQKTIHSMSINFKSSKGFNGKKSRRSKKFGRTYIGRSEATYMAMRRGDPRRETLFSHYSYGANYRAV